MNKKKSLFGKIIWGYVAVWIVVTVVVCIKLWMSLGTYQNNYDAAKAAVEPDLAAEKFLYLFDEQHLAETLQEAGVTVESDFADVEDLAKQLLRDYVGKTIAYERNEAYTDKKPVYDIKAGNEQIGILQLTADQLSDDYGFRQWVVKNANVSVDHVALEKATIIVPDTATVRINGVLVPDIYLSKNGSKEETLAKQAEEISGISKQTAIYQVTGLLDNPDIVVTDEFGNDIMLTSQEDNIFTYTTLAEEDFIKEVQDLVQTVSEAYIMNANNELSFVALSQYIEPGSEAYESIQSVQSGLAWAGKSDVINITESSASDYVQYGDTAFTVKTYNKLYREYRGETYEDEFSYEWLFVKSGNSYKVRAFRLA